jgi:hypothetical protein
MHRIAALLAVLVCMVAITPPAWADSRDAEWWAGYMAVNPDGFRTVSARWTVPKAEGCDEGEYSTVAVWVGMGSQTTTDPGEQVRIDQAGTITECENGKVKYEAIAEAYPAEAVTLFEVEPGHTVYSRVRSGDGKFEYLVVDYNSGVAARGEMRTKGVRKSAEVIVEGPDGQELTRFTRVHLQNARINRRPIGEQDDPIRWTMIDPGSSDRKVRAYASQLTDGGSDFNVYFMRP